MNTQLAESNTVLLTKKSPQCHSQVSSDSRMGIEGGEFIAECQPIVLCFFTETRYIDIDRIIFK